MKAEVIVSSGDSLSVITTSHNGLSLQWDAGVYIKANLNTIEAVFRDINGFWAQLPMEKQDDIWGCYQLIHETLNGVGDFAKLQNRLSGLVKTLYEYHSLQDINKYVQLYTNIAYPVSLKEIYGPNDPKDRTYLRSDYVKLVNLAIALRPMVPIWGEYILRVRNQSGSNYKEYQAVGLLSKAYIISCEPMTQLRDYVTSSSQYATRSVSAIMGGLGSTELPEWLLAITLIRRVALGEVSAIDDKTNLVSNIYNFVTNTLTSLDRKFDGRINEKYRENDGAGDDDNASLAESYKIKQPVSDGDLIAIGVYCEDPHKLALQIDPSVSLDVLNSCLHSLDNMGEMEIKQHHITLTQWVTAVTLPPRGIPHLNKPTMLNVMAVTQAILWHWGFNDLACLATASTVEMKANYLLGAADSRAKISRALVEELALAYPHVPRPTNRERTVRQSNPGCKAVDLLCAEMVRSEWYIHAPQELINISSAGNNNRRMVIPADIKNQLAELVLKIAKRG